MNEEEKLKYLYEYSKSVDFDYEKTEEMCKKLELSGYLLCTTKYLKSLNLDKNVMEEQLEKIKDKREKSKSKFLRKLNRVNPVLLQHGIETNYLYETEAEMKIMGKYVINCCFKLGVRKTQVKVSQELGIGVSQISKLIESYYDLVKSRNLEEYEQLKKQLQENSNQRRNQAIHDNNSNAKTHIVLRKLLNARKLSEVIEIIDSSSFDYSTLKNQVWGFSLCQSNPKLIDENLNKKLEAYSKYKSNQRNEKRKLEKEQYDKENRQKNIEEAILIIEEFLNTDLLLNKFLKIKNISTNKMSEYVQILSEENVELYNQYKERVSNAKKENYKDLISKAKQLANYIIFGIEINGDLKQFTILDYHLMSENSYQTILKVAETALNAYEFSRLKDFFEKNKKGFVNNFQLKNQVLNSSYVVNVQKDKRGDFIPGTGEEVSAEVKNSVINYLKTNTIPLNDLTFNIALQRYLKNELDIEKLVK